MLGISTSSTACKSYPELCFVCLIGIIAFGSCFTFSKYLAILISLYVYLSTLCNSASCILFDNTFLAPENTCSALSILAFNFLYALINAVSMICSFIVCNSASCVLSALVPVDSLYLLFYISCFPVFAMADSIPRFYNQFTVQYIHTGNRILIFSISLSVISSELSNICLILSISLSKSLAYSFKIFVTILSTFSLFSCTSCLNVLNAVSFIYVFHLLI